MDRRKVWIGCWIVVSFLASGTTARAQGCDVKKPETCLQQAFTAFCKAAQSDISACNDVKRPGVQWLRLDLYCGDDKTKAGCADFHAVKEATTPLILAYDHAAGTWQAKGRLEESRVKRDVGGKPTVSLAPSEDLVIIIERTNPLLYVVSRSAVTEAATPEAAQFQKLATLLGGNIQSLLASLAEARVGAQAGGPFDSYLDAVETSLRALEATNSDVSCLLRQSTEQRGRIVAFLQAIELGRAHEFPLAPRACSTTPGWVFGTAQLAAAFEALGRDSLAALQLDPGCPTALSAGLKVLSQDGTKPADVRAAIADFEVARSTEVCHPLLLKAMRSLGDTIADISSAPDAGLPAALKAEVGTKRDLQINLAMSARLKTVSTTASSLAAERDNAGKAIASVIAFNDLLTANVTAPPITCGSAADGQCQTADAVDRRLFLEANAKPVQWDKIQTHTIQVKAASPFAASVVASRPSSVETAVMLDSVQRGLWGIGASVIWTSLKSPTFSAVTHPTDPSKMVIAETDQEVRAGGLALLVDYRLGRKLFPGSRVGQIFGLEFGAAADTSKPGFFGGLSFQLGRFVRLGGGITYQRIKALRGQNLGDVVKATSDIKMRQRFEDGAYLSLSIGLEQFRLFTVN
jgi:hypothetical protein